MLLLFPIFSIIYIRMCNLHAILEDIDTLGAGAELFNVMAFHYRPSTSLNESAGQNRLLLGLVPGGDFMGPFTWPILLGDKGD
jgi:hypothetical protein